MPDNKPRWSDEKLEQFYREFTEHRKEFMDHAQEEKNHVERFMKAFPDDDPVGHRQYHEAVMRAAEAQERFWSELRLDIAKKSFWGLIVLVCGLLLAGGAVKLGIKP